MTDKIQQARRKIFENDYVQYRQYLKRNKDGSYKEEWVDARWYGFNAAPDSVEVLRAVQEQFNRFGERFPDGFDGRIFRWVDDAVAAYALDAPVQQVSVPDGWRLMPPKLTAEMERELNRSYGGWGTLYQVILDAAPAAPAADAGVTSHD